MSDKLSSTPPKSPTDIARETFKRLALERIAPTPEAYRRLYVEISGVSDDEPVKADVPQVRSIDDILPSDAENLLSGFARTLQKSSGELASFGHRFGRALKTKNWDDYAKGLNELATKVTTKPSTGNPIELVDSIAPTVNPPTKKFSLVDDDTNTGQKEAILKDLLFRTLGMALASLLKATPQLAAESESLAGAIKVAGNESELNHVSARLKQLCFQIELKSGDTAEQQELLLRLFTLLLENVRELLDDDNWLRGQIEVVQNLISGPIDHRALQEATRSLKDVIYKQGVLKHSLAESKTSVKNMMATFIDRLDVMTNTTTNYQKKIDHYSHKISNTRDLNEVESIIHGILDETQTIQLEATNSHQIMLAAQKEVKEAEVRIKELEDKLAHMSELVREDQLTGSLNRRGLDDVFEREADRADRRGTPMCAAMLDLDNFKKLNDTHGHSAGDEALIHVVRIVKQTLRSIDVIARYGGEEFLIVMPETSLEEAANAMTRVQRELTTHFFMANDQRLFITFSAGVALRAPHEAQDSVVKRADKAMYEAKKSGKNRVIVAN
ncbi:GGDEF domain-containing protein [Undibacterium seohonense]|jgi:diguanylate cyclase|uniref:diguanylate cyclase n=1 Tax=Undibacterium seohonense TaxID=1344950 RepID=A0ABR6X7W8_9BURK|nr:GGDEF domain-containing protein [Undibacterium seohonense]MBC3809045.1 GGDEF domain-containing protein [Undibacterium seohonense]